MSDDKQKFSGRDLAEAIAAARQRFGVSRQEIGFEILQQGKTGLVAEGEPRVEILAWTREAPPPPPVRPGRGFGRDEGRGRGPRGAGGRDRGPRGSGPRDRAPRSGARDEGPRERPSWRERDREPEPVELTPLLPPPEVADPKAILDQLAKALVRGLGLELRVEGVEETGAGLRVRLDGEDSALLLEADGEGLDAMQYLANRILQKDGRLSARVSFDAAGFRAAAETRLIAEARQAVEEVRASGETRKMRPMGPYERRIVHMALADLPGVKTFSTGSGYHRRLHIAPIDAPESPDVGEED